MSNSIPRRVLYFDHTAMLGGGEIALLNLVRLIDRTVVYPVIVLGAEGPLAAALRSVAEVHILALPDEIRAAKKDKIGPRSFLHLGRLISIALYIRRLRRFIRQNGIDIVHTNSLKADIIGGLAARLGGKPVIWHVRDRIADDYLPSAVAKGFRLLSRFVPTFIVANSAATMETLQLSGKSRNNNSNNGNNNNNKDRKVVIHDGTTLPEDPVPPGNGNHLLVALIGRISPWKGQDVFLRAVSRVSARFPNARFKIVGTSLFGEREYESSVRTLCDELELDNIVEFTGFCVDIASVLRNLDVLVHASTIGEPFGQVIIEGMAAAKPVVATNGGGVPEIVVHNETGLLVPMRDVEAMAEAICKLLADPSKRHSMGNKGRERVRAYFTIERTVKKVQAVYERLGEGQQTSSFFSSYTTVGRPHNATLRILPHMTPHSNEMDIGSIVLRRWKQCLLWSLPFAALFVIVVFLLPKQYDSEMKILVNNERQDPVVSTDYLPYKPQAQEQSEYEVNSEGEILHSTDVLRDVVLKTGLSNPDAAASDSTKVSPAELDRAIRKLDRKLEIEAVKRSKIINVSYRVRTPELANRVMRELASRYLVAHVQVHNTSGTYQLFDQQASRYGRELAQSEAALATFREGYSLVVMPDQQEILAQRATDARAALEDADAQVAQIDQRLTEEKHAIANMDARITTQQRVIPDADLVQRLTATLVDLKNQRTVMASKFRSDDRLVVQLDLQIADTQTNIDRANQLTHTEQTSDINLVRQQTERDLVSDAVSLAGAKARKDKLMAAHKHYTAEMFKLASAAVKNDSLIRRVKENEDNYLLYTKKREQARIESVLDQDRVASVALAEQPTLTVEPAFPNLLIAIPLALILAMCAGTAVVCVGEYSQQKQTNDAVLMDQPVAVAS
jgi:glycosyltransferase involved in cell wall biosynthesis/uncharacterized protein involved in exopolysaccharide biosynthesis